MNKSVISTVIASLLLVSIMQFTKKVEPLTIETYEQDIEVERLRSSKLTEEHDYRRLKEIKLAEEKEKELKLMKSQVASIIPPPREKNKVPTRGGSKELGVFTVTCYDLSVQSCGKPIGSKGYGITASGFDLTGHTWETARSIAVDPKVIPLGSQVEITFSNENYSKYNGIYTARDTGGAIKQNKIDFFLGDYNQNEAHQDVWNFGKTKAVLKIID